MFTYQNFIYIIFSVLLSSFSIAQDADTTAVEEEGSGKEMYTSVDVSFTQDKGNTDQLSLYYGFNYTLIGDFGPFKDSEFLFDFSRNDDQLDGESFTDDQSLTLMFDVWANQRISPFLFFQQSFDNIIGLEDRMNYGLGAKVRLPFGLSVSYAFLFEKEDYKFWSYDSLAYNLDEDGNLYGNLGPRQIHDKLISDLSIDIEPGNIITGNIGVIGNHDVTIRFYDDIAATLKLEITKKN